MESYSRPVHQTYGIMILMGLEDNYELYKCDVNIETFKSTFER